MKTIIERDGIATLKPDCSKCGKVFLCWADFGRHECGKDNVPQGDETND
jgi:ribosomal protein S27AE